MTDCIFCKIIKGEIAADIKYSDDSVIAFADVNPQSPVHVVVVTREHIGNLNEATDEVVGHCINVARELSGKLGIADQGYRIVVNCNKFGGQEVDHLHAHLLGGRQMKWPPG